VAEGETTSGNKWVAPAAILAGAAIVVALLVRGRGETEQPPPDPRTATVQTETQSPTPQTDPPPSAGAGALITQSRDLEKQGKLDEALQAARQAIDAGAGRDGSLQAAKLEILRENYGSAKELLTPLTADGKRDADAEYNLGLIAQRQRKYNAARTHYLTTLEVEPRYAAARFNLAVLARDFGFNDEAGHHAREFAKQWPEDPRVKDLAPLMAAKAAPAATRKSP
jgi:tetratricopeptide (TPR) repeat protein